MRTRMFLLAAAVAGALGTSCGPVEVHGAYAVTPRLAYVGPDVAVVADYGQPVFFADNFYWLFYDGLWYRSTYYDHGWLQVVTVPVVIARIDRPDRYRHYRGTPWVPGRTVDHRLPYQQPMPRANRVPPPRTPPPRLPQAPRDHRH